MNEEEFARKHIETGELGDKPYYTMAAISKYLYQVRGMPEDAIIKFLQSLLEVSGSYYWNKRRFWKAEIIEIVKSHKNDKIHVINDVVVTDTEWQKIVSIGNTVLEQLVFTILTLAKFCDKKRNVPNGWLNLKTKEIFDIAGLHCSTKEQDKYLNGLMKLGLIEFPAKSTNLSIRVTFIDDSAEKFVEINDMRAIGYRYLYINGGNFIHCKKCGVLTRGNKAGTKKYCSKCAKYQTIKNRKVTCVDCNKVFSVPASNHKSNRCPDCYIKYRKTQKRLSAESKAATVGEMDKSILS